MGFKPLQEYKILVDGGATAEAALELPLPNPLENNRLAAQLQLTAKNTDLVVKLGGSDVVADATLTSGARVARNFTVAAGLCILINLKADEKYISVIAEDEATTTGVLYVTLGHADRG